MPERGPNKTGRFTIEGGYEHYINGILRFRSRDDGTRESFDKNGKLEAKVFHDGSRAEYNTENGAAIARFNVFNQAIPLDTPPPSPKLEESKIINVLKEESSVINTVSPENLGLVKVGTNTKIEKVEPKSENLAIIKPEKLAVQDESIKNYAEKEETIIDAEIVPERKPGFIEKNKKTIEAVALAGLVAADVGIAGKNLGWWDSRPPEKKIEEKHVASENKTNNFFTAPTNASFAELKVKALETNTPPTQVEAVSAPKPPTLSAEELSAQIKDKMAATDKEILEKQKKAEEEISEKKAALEKELEILRINKLKEMEKTLYRKHQK